MKDRMTDKKHHMNYDRLCDMASSDRALEITDEEKQELRADFIEKAKDMQLAWISPRTQMTAGLDAADVECREGFSLVLSIKRCSYVSICRYCIEDDR